MHHLLRLPAVLSLLAFTSGLPIEEHAVAKPLPLLIWHGLGDRYDADGLRSTGDLAVAVHPGTYVYYVRTDEDGGSDRTNTFFGNITLQMDQVCEDIRNEPHLRKHDLRVDALGFSQGGQFLRGLVERCDGLSVRSLVTFGSQHNGIAEFQHCGTFDLLCKGATALVGGNAWTEYVQNKVVPAQYYREINETTGLGSDDYLAGSNFLADVNNERETKNETYTASIAALEHFAMFVFEDDVTVVPKESGWFAQVNATSGEVTPLRERTMYKEDWLGLKKLDEKDGLHLKTSSGAHMQLDDKTLRKAFEEYFGPERDTGAKWTSGSCEDILDFPSNCSEVDGKWVKDHQALLKEYAQCRRERYLVEQGDYDATRADDFEADAIETVKSHTRCDKTPWWEQRVWDVLKGDQITLDELKKAHESL